MTNKKLSNRFLTPLILGSCVIIILLFCILFTLRNGQSGQLSTSKELTTPIKNTTPNLTDAFRYALSRQQLDGGITVDTVNRKISLKLNVNDQMTDKDAKALLNKIFMNVSTITGEQNISTILKQFEFVFEIHQSTVNGKILFRALKNENSIKFKWS